MATRATAQAASDDLAAVVGRLRTALALPAFDGDARAALSECLEQDSGADLAEDSALAGEVRAVALRKDLGLRALQTSGLFRIEARLHPRGSKRDLAHWYALRALFEAGATRDAYELARELWRVETTRAGDPRPRPSLLLEIARAFEGARDARAAHEVLDRIEREVADPAADVLTGVQLLRGAVYLAAGAPELAGEYLRRGRERADAAASKPNTAAPARLDEAWQREVEFLIGVRRAESALSRLDELAADERWKRLNAARRAYYTLLRAHALLQVYRTARDRGSPAPAFEGALQQAEQAGDGHTSRLARVGWARFELRFGDLERARELVAELDEPGPGALPTPLVVKTATLRSRIERAFSSDRAALARRRDALCELYGGLLEQWSTHSVDGSGNGFLLFEERRDLLDELARVEVLVDTNQGPYRALGHFVDAQRCGTLARRLGGDGPFDVASIPKRIDSGSGLLVYLPPTALGSYVLAIDATGVTLGEVGPVVELREARERWLSALTQAASQPDAWRVRGAPRQVLVAQEREAAAQLARHLLPQAVHPRLREWERVSIVGLDSIGYLPFEWLPLGGERFLGESLAICTLPSLPALFEREPRAPSSLDYLFVGGVEHEAGAQVGRAPLEPLPIASAQLDGLCAPFGASCVSVLGVEATRENVLEALSAGARIAHLLVHGDHDLSNARPAALALAPAAGDDGRLDCGHLDDARVDVDLVLLTACRSGLGAARLGDANAADLTGGFLAAGARTVLVTHSDLRFAPALELSREWLASLGVAGLSPGASLRAQRRRWIEEDPATAPFRGPLLELVGDGHRALFAPQARADDTGLRRRLDWAWVLTLFAALSAAGLIALRRARLARAAR